MEMMNLLFPLERTFMRRLLAAPAREMKLFESQLYRKRRFFTSAVPEYHPRGFMFDSGLWQTNVFPS